MARYIGNFGYGTTVEDVPGVSVNQITEHSYIGDVDKVSRKLQDSDTLNGELTVQNEITVVADQFANDNFQNIKYVMWSGAPWTVSSVTVERPRLIIRLGEPYNGPTA